MKSLAKKLLLSVIFVVMMLATSITVFADGTGGGNTSAGGGSWGNTTGQATFSYFGMKFTICKRSEILVKDGINPNDYNAMLNPGFTVAMADTRAPMSAPTGDEMYWTGGSVDFVRNAHVSFATAASVLNLGEVDLRQCVQTCISGGNSLSGAGSNRAYLGYSTWSDLMNTRFSEKSSTMLYNEAERSAFYDRFANALASRGVSPAISKDEFMKDGVLVIIPVIGVQGGGYLNFQTVHRMSFLPAAEKKTYSVKYFAGGNPYNSPSNGDILYYVGDASKTSGGSNCIYALGYLGTYWNKFDVDNNYIGDMGNPIFASWMNDDWLRADIKNNWRNSMNWRYGFGVYGLGYKGGTTAKAATDITLKATQKDNGSFDVTAVISNISQQAGTMHADLTSFTKGAFDGMTGGRITDSAYRGVSNVMPDWDAGHNIAAYGSFLVGGSGTIDIAKSAEKLRATLDMNVAGKENPVNSADFNVGSMYTPKWFYQKPQDVANIFGMRVTTTPVTNVITQGFTKPKTDDKEGVYYNVVAAANNKSHITSAKLEKTADAKTAGSGTVVMKPGDEYGVGVTMLSKGVYVESCVSFAELVYDKDGDHELVYDGYDRKPYETSTYGTFNLDKYERYYVAMCPNSTIDKSYWLLNNCDNQNFWAEIDENAEGGMDEGKYSSITKGVVDRNATIASGTKKGATLAAGSKDGLGYSIFVLGVKYDTGEDSGIIDKSGIVLQDYQINFVHQDIMKPTNGKLTNSGEYVINPSNVSTSGCVFGSSIHRFYYERSYLYKIKHTSATRGKSIDASAGKKDPYILYNTALGRGYTLKDMQKGQQWLDTRTAKRYTYAIDLSRGVYGDIRAISALSSNSLDSKSKKILMNKHKMKYGVVPSNENGTPVATIKRSSAGTIFNGVGDTFEWDSQWKIGGKAPKDTITKTHSGQIWIPDYDPETGIDNGYWRWVSDSWHVLVSSGAKPLLYNGSGVYNMKIAVDETIYKYSTEKMVAGVNKNVNNDLKGSAISSGALKHGSDYKVNKSDMVAGGKDNDIMYRQAIVTGADYELKYYPEVRMRAYLVTGDTINGKNNITPKTVITMAEQARKTKPSSLYLMKLDSDAKKEELNQFSGSVFSDTMGAGTNSVNASKGNAGGELPIIYGGSDVTLKITTPNNMKLNLYGYSLDLANYDVDKNGLKYADGSNQPYTEIVNDTSSENRDPYTTWGNDSTDSTNKMKKQFNTWVTSVANSLAADVTLKVTKDGEDNTEPDKQYNAFNVSLSKDKAESYTASNFTSVYNIVIKRGTIDTTTAQYRALINQIAKDYGCSYNEAEDVFESSDIYQSITRSIEDIRDSFNKAQKVDTTENGAHAVRNDNTNDNWYDEEVKTFVIRRYKAEPIEIKDLVLTDKIDYNASPDSTAGKDYKVNGQQAKYNTRVGQWYLTLYFKYDKNHQPTGAVADKVKVDNIYLNGDTFFKPEEDGSIDKIDSAYNVLLNQAYISGADFKIPSATTNNMLW